MGAPTTHPLPQHCMPMRAWEHRCSLQSERANSSYQTSVHQEASRSLNSIWFGGCLVDASTPVSPLEQGIFRSQLGDRSSLKMYFSSPLTKGSFPVSSTRVFHPPPPPLSDFYEIHLVKRRSQKNYFCQLS